MLTPAEVRALPNVARALDDTAALAAKLYPGLGFRCELAEVQGLWLAWYVATLTVCRGESYSALMESTPVLAPLASVTALRDTLARLVALREEK